MARVVSVTPMSELASFTSVVIPLVVADGSLSVAAGVPATVNGVTLPSEISSEWCEHQGLRAKLGSSVTFRNVDGTSVTLIVTNGASTSLEQWRQMLHRLFKHLGCLRRRLRSPLFELLCR